MPSYSLRNDGLADVTLDNGTVLPMALSEQELQAMGAVPASAQGIAPPPSAVMTEGLAQAAPMPMTGGAEGIRDFLGAPQQATDAPPPAIARPSEPQPRTVADLVPPNPNAPSHRPGVTGGVSPNDLAAPAPAPQGAPQQQQGTGGDLDPVVQAVFQQALAGQGGPRRPAGPQLAQRKVEYTQTDPETAAYVAQQSEDLKEAQSDIDIEHRLQLETRARNQESVLRQRGDLLQERRDDIESERFKREATNKYITDLRDTMQQREQEAANIKTPELADFWAEKGIFGQLMAGISIVLGAAGAHAPGGNGENVGLTMVNQTIDRWIAEQRGKYEKAANTADRARNAYAEAIKIYGSPEEAEADLRQRAFAVRDAMLTNFAEEIGTAEAFEAADLAVQQGQIEREKSRVAAIAQAGRKVEEIWKAPAGGGGGSGGLLGALKKAAEAQASLNTIRGKNPDKEDKSLERKVRLPDGSYAYARSGVDARRAQSVVAANTRLADLADKVTDLTKSTGGRAWGSAEKERASTILNEMIFTYKDAAQAGALDKGLQEVLERYFGNPQDFFRNPAAAAKLGEVASQARRKVDDVKRFDLHADSEGNTPYEDKPQSFQAVE